MKKTTVGLTVCAVLASGMTGVVTFAQEVLDEQQSFQAMQSKQTVTSQNADVSVFTLENHPNFAAYQQQFAIKAERIQISANKPNYGDLTYAAMMDGDKATYWAPSTRDDVEKTEVEFTFDELVTLDQITYSARQNVGTDSGGFPHQFEIYGAMADDAEYTLVASGSEATATKSTIAIQFPATQFKKLKFKFVETSTKTKWAHIGEIAFYQPDAFAATIADLFTTPEKNVVNPSYANLETLAQLLIEAKAHPLADELVASIIDAQTLLTHTPIEATAAQVQVFPHYENQAYRDMFEIPSEQIAGITNNGGKYSKFVIENAIDNNLATHWETGTANSDTFKNEVIVTFTEQTTIDRLAYSGRADKYGFAEVFEIYASPTSEGETFELLATGSATATSSLVEVKFEPTQMKRIKFKFIKGRSNRAIFNEIAFYRQDEVKEIVEDLFVDTTYLELKQPYNNLTALNQLQQAVDQHPNGTEFQPTLDWAFKVINGEIDENIVAVTAFQHGNMDAHGKNIISTVAAGQNLQTTGVYGLPGETITVYVDVEPGTTLLPSISFTQNHGTWKGWQTTRKLKAGRNEIVVPTFNLTEANYPNMPNPGGAMYIVNPYTREEQGRAPRIRIDGGHAFPLYREGDDEATFIAELTAYQAKLTAAQAAGDPTVLDLFEFESERMLISALASSAYQVYVEEGIAPSATVEDWNWVMNEIFAFHGLDGSSEIHDPKYLKEHIRLMQPFGSLYAHTHHIGIQNNHTASVLRPGVARSWGFMHEIGHRMDSRYRAWAEITNNMDSVYMSMLGGNINDRIKYETLYKKTAVLDENAIFRDDVFVSLGTFWQLQMVNENYWPQLERLYRERQPEVPNDESKIGYLVQYSSEVFGLDLTEHFARQGMRVNETFAAEIAAKYPKSTTKYWYLNTKGYEYQGSGLAADARAEIVTFEKDGTMTLANTAAEADFLGYEILRDGEVIGFTSTNSFKDPNYDLAANYQYTVIPYGVDLRAGVESLPHANYTPSITLKETDVYVPLYGEFNPLDYVTALDYANKDIADQVTVDTPLDMTKKGDYTVTYTVTDYEVSRSVSLTVHVLAQANPLSDLDWETATQSYKTPQKDGNLNGKALSLTSEDGEAIIYDKGLGTHANAEIVYQLPVDQYVRFQSYIGIEHDMSHRTGTVTFEVYVDGEKRYDSGVMKAGHPQKYFSLDITGASELKLVVTDAGNGNGADHATWGNPVLLSVSEVPVIEIEADQLYEAGPQLDVATVIGAYQAFDAEDGDLTDQVQITGLETFTPNKPGHYEINYTVTDSEGNTTTKMRKATVVDLADYVYLTDYEWTKATQSYSSTQKDQHVSGSPLRLTDEFGASVTYERGLGTHANANIIYDLTQTDAVIFSTYVGVDHVMYNSSAASIIFEIYVDGKKVAATNVMRAKDPQQYLQVDITGAKELKLVVTDAGNGNSSDHGSFGDAKLHYVNEARADITQLQTLIAELDALETDIYSAASVAHLQAQLAAAKALIARGDVMQIEADTMSEALIQAREQLEIVSYEVFIPDAKLKQGIMQTLGLTSETIMSHELERLEALDLEGSYVRDLTGLEYAINLKSLNLNYTEVTDLRPLQNLPKLTELQVNESFLDLGYAPYGDGFFNLEPTTVYDKDGQVLEPTELVLSSGATTMTLPVESVYVDGKIQIDAKLLGGQAVATLEIKYASNVNAFSVYTFHWLQ
ncbi:MAG: NPCBM/NEW2 domain-containing protein, partial [Culicoidibacterales bacterium]